MSDAGAGGIFGPKRYGAHQVQFASEEAFRPARTVQLDEADLRIIDRLVQDGRANARSMTSLTGLTEETVASRMRSLMDRGIIGITAIFDWHAAGYHWDLFLAVECEAGPVGPVVERLAKLDEITSIYTVFGSVDLVCHVLLHDREAMLRFLSSTLTQVEGIRKVDVLVVLDTVKYFHQFAWVPLDDVVIEFPEPIVELSELDLDIIGMLLHNGRTSNREIGRQLGVADGTVRMHVSRLQEAGLVRVCAQVHPARSGMVNARAHVGISVQGGDTAEVATMLAGVPEIVTISMTSGRYELLCYVLARSRTRLIEVVAEEIRPLTGVRATETWEVIDGPKHISHWARW